MQLREQLEVLTNPDRIRLYKDNKVIFTGFAASLKTGEYGNGIVDGTEEVTKLRAVPEIRHKKWKELGLMQPMKPEKTPDYSFSDLQLTLYYDIYI